MTLNEWASSTKRSLYTELLEGRAPSVGEFDAALLSEARTLGVPQMGSTTFSPEKARHEFVYSSQNSTIVFSVHVATPEPIVFMPVPAWVVETIWQGDIDGSFHFMSDAQRLLHEFSRSLEPEANVKLFERKQPTRRE